MIDMFEGRDGLKNYSFWVFIWLLVFLIVRVNCFGLAMRFNRYLCSLLLKLLMA